MTTMRAVESRRREKRRGESEGVSGVLVDTDEARESGIV